MFAKLNVLVAGGAGSGKTSLLGALAGCVPAEERIVVIEDVREIQPARSHVVGLEARPPDPHRGGGVTIRELFRAALRLRPDRIIIGEIRAAEALDIVQAMTSGHGGCMGTLHATLPCDTLSRLETMCLMSDTAMPLSAIRGQIGSGVDLLVQVSRLRDGCRKVTHLTEVNGFDVTTGEYALRDLFLREYHGVSADGRVMSELVCTGQLPLRSAQLREHGADLPAAMYEAANRRERGGR